ncbi:MAG: efflux RND transporter permease subunit [Thermodesulfovibrionales bacterium]|nr:efflux RND transporter permease subunit [Thermodesulfovibrionales bacterium]
MKVGLSGRIAEAFLRSKLTPLLVISSLLLGLFAIVVTPREEEPQIVVPMVDVIVTYPGATAKEVEERVTRPMEKLLWEIKGVEYIYSIVRPGYNLTIVRFYVGEDIEDSLVNLYNKLMSNYDIIPPGVSQPLVKPKSIDDVPILTLTLWSENSQYTGYELRRIGTTICDEIKKDKNVSEFNIIGGQRRQIRINLDIHKLNAYSISPLHIMGILKNTNLNLPSGSVVSKNTEILVETGATIKDAEDLNKVLVSVYNGKPIYLKYVSTITDSPEEPSNYVFMGLGPSAQKKGIKAVSTNEYFEAVTITIAKKKGANASIVAKDAIEKVNALKGNLIPKDVNITITRNYGDTAKEKSDELLEHMLIATISVIILIALALGWRESIVVAVAVPVTLALTLLINYLYGYTLNRVTLFALIFSIGILVDDAIVVVENIHRHFKTRGVSPQTAVGAVDEVGNPTILATFTVIAALLPMAFVSGLMGPYMRPIPVGASAAMLFSLLVAFIVSPWLSYIVLKNVKGHASDEQEEGGFMKKVYTKTLGPLIESRFKRLLAIGVVGLLLLITITMIPLKLVKVKMLPFDNKSELQVIIDMPEGRTLEETAQLTRELGDFLKTVPEVSDYQMYVGTAGPFNFNGLVRHYFLRSGSNVADIQVNLVAKGERKEQSHDIAKRIRPPLQQIGLKYGANIKIAEIPPGPPVLSTLVAEIYGPELNRQIEIAREIKKVFTQTDGVVDVDWYVEDDQRKLQFVIDRQKVGLHKIDVANITNTLRTIIAGMPVGLVHFEDEKEPVEILLRAPIDQRSYIETIKSLTLTSQDGTRVPLRELVSIRQGIEEKTIYRKNLKRVVYVIGDVAGVEESPVYAILKMKSAIQDLKLKEGYELKQYNAIQPWLEDRYAMKWDGEWHITIEVFRDLGVAFAAVLVIIYILVVAWFRSFITPIVIMAPIPLTLVGILPGHWVFDAFFTATSMIGFIALSGIIVRNSILLVDFVEMQWRQTNDLKDAIIMAGAVRFRPIVLTAAAVVVGSFVMLFDPIFQGLAISMMFGAVAATLLTLIAVPLLYYEFFRNKESSNQQS